MMPDAEFKTPKKRGCGCWVLALLLLLSPLIYLGGRVGYFMWRFSPGRLVGRTPQQIVEAVGNGSPFMDVPIPAPPGYVEPKNSQEAMQRLSAGEPGSLMFSGFYWDHFLVHFSNGVADRVSHLDK